MEGTSGRQRVSWQSLSEYELAKIEPEERREIGKILRAFDDKIALNQQTNQTLEQIAQAIFKSWFVDFDPVRAKMAVLEEGGTSEAAERAAMRAISAKDDATLEQMQREIPAAYTQLAQTAALFPSAMMENTLGDVPEGWRSDSIYGLCDVIYGAPFKSKQFNTDKEGLPLVRIRDLKDEAPGVYTEEVHPKGYLIQNGDLIVGMDGEFKPYVWGGNSAWMNQRICCFRPKIKQDTFLLKGFIAPQLEHYEKTATATTVIHLGKKDIDSFVYLNPGSDLIQAYSSKVDELCKMFVNNKLENLSLSELRDVLLPKLLSGEIKVG